MKEIGSFDKKMNMSKLILSYSYSRPVQTSGIQNLNEVFSSKMFFKKCQMGDILAEENYQNYDKDLAMVMF